MILLIKIEPSSDMAAWILDGTEYISNYDETINPKATVGSTVDAKTICYYNTNTSDYRCYDLKKEVILSGNTYYIYPDRVDFGAYTDLNAVYDKNDEAVWGMDETTTQDPTIYISETTHNYAKFSVINNDSRAAGGYLEVFTRPEDQSVLTEVFELDSYGTIDDSKVWELNNLDEDTQHEIIVSSFSAEGREPANTVTDTFNTDPQIDITDIWGISNSTTDFDVTITTDTTGYTLNWDLEDPDNNIIDSGSIVADISSTHVEYMWSQQNNGTYSLSPGEDYKLNFTASKSGYSDSDPNYHIAEIPLIKPRITNVQKDIGTSSAIITWDVCNDNDKNIGLYSELNSSESDTPSNYLGSTAANSCRTESGTMNEIGTWYINSLANSSTYNSSIAEHTSVSVSAFRSVPINSISMTSNTTTSVTIEFNTQITSGEVFATLNGETKSSIYDGYSTSITWTGLSSATEYTLTNAYNLEPGHTRSDYYGDVTVNTVYPSYDVTFYGFIENFEDQTFDGWFNSPYYDHDQDWQIISGSTGSTGTGPSSAYEGSYYAYVETSGGYADTTGDTSTLYFDFGSTVPEQLKFVYNANGAEVGDLRIVQVYDGYADTFTISSGDRGDVWRSYTYDIPSTLIRVGIEYYRTTDGYTGDIAIDNLRFIEKIEEVSYGSDATPPTNPDVPDYTFDGWSGNYTNVTSDEDVYAQFSKTSYTWYAAAALTSDPITDITVSWQGTRSATITYLNNNYPPENYLTSTAESFNGQEYIVFEVQEE